LKPLEAEIDSEATLDPTNWTEISCHFRFFSLPLNSGGQTRRFLGGRQPLWGIGVTSLIRVIASPVA